MTLYAILVILALSGLVLAIGAVGIRQYQLITIGANSQKAQYYAESAFECAVFARIDRYNGGPDVIECAGNPINSAILGVQYIFFPGGGCATVEYTPTSIIARAYDRGVPPSCPGSGASVERGYEEVKLQSQIGI